MPRKREEDRLLEMVRESLKLQVETLEELRHLSYSIRRIERELITPRLVEIRIAFTAPSTSKGDPLMAVQGPVTLTTVGQVATASILGFDQFGNPWAGPIPPVSFSIDDTAGAIVTSKDNGDGTDTVAAVANGVANLTASLTTAEGVELTDTETITVAIPVVPPPTSVLSSIKIAFTV